MRWVADERNFNTGLGKSRCAFDERTRLTRFDNPYTFTGRRLDDESGIYYYRNRYYHAQLGRFVSRDPVGFQDGMNLYQYTRSNSIRFTDPSGKKSNPPIGRAKQWCDYVKNNRCWFVTKRFIEAQEWCACLTWHERECKRGAAWMAKLPNCPCSIGVSPRNPNPRIWEDPKKPGALERPGHPNAENCMRSKPTPGGHGQQCCYDGMGRLITSGPSAGTVDYVSPGQSVFGHNQEDVKPYYTCSSRNATWIYLQHRPPNNGLNCPENRR